MKKKIIILNLFIIILISMSSNLFSGFEDGKKLFNQKLYSEAAIEFRKELNLGNLDNRIYIYLEEIYLRYQVMKERVIFYYEHAQVSGMKDPKIAYYGALTYLEYAKAGGIKKTNFNFIYDNSFTSTQKNVIDKVKDRIKDYSKIECYMKTLECLSIVNSFSFNEEPYTKSEIFSMMGECHLAMENYIIAKTCFMWALYYEKDPENKKSDQSIIERINESLK